MNTKKPGLTEVLQMCETAEKLIKAIFTAREQKKGDRNKCVARLGVFSEKSANQYSVDSTTGVRVAVQF